MYIISIIKISREARPTNSIPSVCRRSNFARDSHYSFQSSSYIYYCVLMRHAFFHVTFLSEELRNRMPKNCFYL